MEFIKTLLSTESSSKFPYRYIDGALYIYTSDFNDNIRPHEPEIKKTTESSYFDILIYFDVNGHLKPSLDNKHNNFYLDITHSPFKSSTIPSSSVNGDFVSQLVRFAIACSKCEVNVSPLDKHDLQRSKSKTNHQMSSNTNRLATANKARHLLKRGGGGSKTNGHIMYF